MEINEDVAAVVNSLQFQLKGTSFAAASALFRELVREFEICIIRLKKLNQTAVGNLDATAATARRLCELSREILFSVNPELISSDIKRLVALLFAHSVAEIDAALAYFKHTPSDQLEATILYRNNLQKRTYHEGAIVENPWRTLELVETGP